MRNTILFLSCLLFFVTDMIGQTYAIDASHSSVQISVQRFGVVDVIGRFKEVSGTINYNEDDVSQTKAEAVIKVDSYDANNVGGEDAVKSAAFLDAENYPEITFKSTGFNLNDGETRLNGTLTIHGQSQEVELPFTIVGPLMDLPTRKKSIAAKASITINRQDYGVSFDRQLPDGTQLVSNYVKITLNILAIAE